ncbi:YetF domain-containing protein [Paenibacillus sp. NPDC056933]|uniref:YetF domain-containing protein n=1 Tax=Paenibacillus sp. NPDC056933 TaxID=3345968 RepID=UPI00362E2885
MFMDLTIKLVISFFGLWAITFITGRKTLSQLTPLDFLTSLVLSEIVGNTLYDDQVKVTHLIFALAVWTALAYLFEKATTRFVKFGYVAEGRVALLIDNGIVNQSLMKKYDIEFKQLLSMLRKQNVFSLQEVKHAVLEIDGSLSVLRKPEYEPPTAQDLGLETQSDNFAITVIDKGELLKKSMRGSRIDMDKVRKEMQKQGYDNIKDIAYAEYCEDGSLYIIPRK